VVGFVKMSKRKVFIPEFNCFGTEVDINLEIDNRLINTLDIETLERLKKTQIEFENYESAGQIQKIINMKDKKFYIQNGWVGNAVLWWGHDGGGYTTDFEKAGKYSYKDTLSIIERPQDIAWECDYVDGCKEAQKLIIDAQYLDGTHSMRGKEK